jgi:hypothetical protein
MAQLGKPGHMVRSRFGDIAVVLFLLSQALDGALTYVGVTLMGLHMEANPVLAWLMSTIGHGPGLAGAKLVAGGFGILLHLSAVHRVVAALALFHMLVAVLPWMTLLFMI